MGEGKGAGEKERKIGKRGNGNGGRAVRGAVWAWFGGPLSRRRRKWEGVSAEDEHHDRDRE